MEDIARLLRDHRADLERWFDGELNRLTIIKGQQLGFYDDMAQRVVGQIEPRIGRISGGSITPESPRVLARDDSTTTLNMSASAAPVAASPSPQLLDRGNVDGNICLPGTTLEEELPKSPNSGTSLVVLHNQDQAWSLGRRVPKSIEDATVVIAPVKPSSQMASKSPALVDLQEPIASEQDQVPTSHSPIPLLYGMDRGARSLSKQPKSRPSSIIMKQELTPPTSMINIGAVVRFHCSLENLKAFTTSRSFRMVCGGVILVKALFLGISADNMAESAILGKADVDTVFETIEIGFCTFFLGELILRLLAGGRAFFRPKNDGWWNIFDTFLVGLSLIDVALTWSQVGKAMNVTFARLMRLFRFVRILRLVRVMRFFYSFRLIIYSVFYSILCLLWVFGMLLFIMYFFAMFFLHGISEYFRAHHEDTGGVCDTVLCLELRHLGGNVIDMVLSLFMSICGGIDWRELWVILRDVNWVYGWTFILYIFFMTFGVLNVVVATFVEQSSLISRRDRELVTQNELEKNRQYYNNIRRFFQEADIDGSGSLSWREFEDYLADENVQAYFQSFELDVTQAQTLFRLLDLDESDDVDIDEFVEGCMRMRGQARSIDVHMLLYENEKMIRRNVEFMQYVEDQLCAIKDGVVACP